MTTTTTLSPAGALIALLKQQEGIFYNAYEGISHEDSLKKPKGSANNINWYIGHVTTCRYMLAGLLGCAIKDPNNSKYFKSITDDNYLPLESFKKDWAEVTEVLLEKLNSLSGEELSKQIEGQNAAPIDYISFFIYHEAYHLGQIGLTRRLLGLPIMKAN
jgi:uncharacterized damage-inducible protein DinB